MAYEKKMRKSLVRLYRTRLLRQNFADLFVCGWFEDQEDRIDYNAKHCGVA
jgi:hypothetical protein